MAIEVFKNIFYVGNGSRENDLMGETDSRKIFENSGLLETLDKIFEESDKKKFWKFGSDDLSVLVLKGFYDNSFEPFRISIDDLEKAKQDGITIFEFYLSQKNEIVLADDVDGQTQFGKKVPIGVEEKYIFIQKALRGEEQLTKSRFYPRKTFL